MTSGNDPLAFFKLMPGFDFMRQFAQAATGKNAVPNLTEWVTPTASVQEIDKRIANLKAVQVWLEQNAQILAATVQALEIQKMTLSVLQGMNLSQADIAKAFTAQKPSAPTPAAEAATVPQAPQAAVKADAAPPIAPAPKPAAQPVAAAQKTAPPPFQANPLQWWGGLTQQFQNISANAMREAAQATLPPVVPMPPHMPPASKPARKSAAKPAAKPGAKSNAKRAAPKKPAKSAPRRGAA